MASAMGEAIGSLRGAARPWALALVLVLATFSASAQRTEGDRVEAKGLYAAEIIVNGQGEAERQVGFARALAQVLTKLTGDAQVASRPGVGQELRRAASYVQGYDYRQDRGVGASGAPSFKTMLVVRFDQEAVDDMVEVLGLPVWSRPRPRPVLWLAIDDGSGPRLVGVSRADAARPTLDQAVKRGFSLGLPAGDASEQALVGAIWRGDAAAVARVSKRYSPPMQLMGKLYRQGGGWAADWTFINAGRVLSQSSHSGANVRTVLATGADVAADALVERYAKPAETSGSAGIYRITFVGIDSADDFIRLSGYLQSLSVVRGLTPVQATPQGMEYDLDLISGIPGFERIVERDGVLSDEFDSVDVYRLNR